MEAGQCLCRWNERENKKRCAEYAGHDNANDCSLGGPHLSTSGGKVVPCVVVASYAAHGRTLSFLLTFRASGGMRLAVDTRESGTYVSRSVRT